MGEIDLKELARKAAEKMKADRENKEQAVEKLRDVGWDIMETISDPECSTFLLPLMNVSAKVVKASSLKEFDDYVDSVKDKVEYAAAIEFYEGILGKTYEITDAHKVEFDEVYDGLKLSGQLTGEKGEECRPYIDVFGKITYSIKQLRALKKAAGK